MPDKTWEELLIWKLAGPRFDEHRGVDLADLAGLVALRTALVELAKILWRHRHQRKRIPDFAEEAVDLRIKRFDDGSEQATVWLGRPQPIQPSQGDIFGSPAVNDFTSFFDSIHEAASVLQDALQRAAANEPQRLPRKILQHLAVTGKSLRADEQWSIQAVRSPALAPSESLPPDLEVLETGGPDIDYGTDAGFGYDEELPLAARTFTRPSAAGTYTVSPERAQPPARRDFPRIVAPVDATLRAKLETLSQPKAPEWRVVQRTLSGEVRMVDVDGLAEGQRGKVRIRTDRPGEDVEIEFLPEHEKFVTAALDKHNRVRLRVRGDAHLDERGKLKRFTAKRVREIKAPNPDALGEELFDRLVTENPDRLVAMLRPGEIDPTLLTYAAEIAGRGLPFAQVVPSLLALLQHERAFVREGALYGLQHHAGKNVTEEVRRLADSDSSPGVRLVAKGILKSR